MAAIKEIFICIMALAGILRSEAQTVPKLTLGASPSLEIKLAPFHAADAPGFNRLLEMVPYIGDIESAGFILTDSSQRAVIGVGVQWSILDKNGQRTVRNSKSHSFFTPGSAPLASAGQRLIVLPEAFIQEPMLQKSGMVVFAPSQRLVSLFSGAAEIHAEIDSIIFDDGEVVGPNTLKLHAEIQARKDAADTVIRQVHTAAAIHLQSNGEGLSPQVPFEQHVKEFIGQIDGKLQPDHPVAVALRQLTERHAPGLVARHTASFARDLLTTRYFRVVFTHIQSVPSRPIFYRKDGQPL